MKKGNFYQWRGVLVPVSPEMSMCHAAPNSSESGLFEAMCAMWQTALLENLADGAIA